MAYKLPKFCTQTIDYSVQTIVAKYKLIPEAKGFYITSEDHEGEGIN